MVVGQVHYSDVVLIIAGGDRFQLGVQQRPGSVLIIMLMHASNNTISGSFFSPMFSGADSVRQSWLLAVVWCVVAIVVILLAGPEDLSRKHKSRKSSRSLTERLGGTSPAASTTAGMRRRRVEGCLRS